MTRSQTLRLFLAAAAIFLLLLGTAGKPNTSPSWYNADGWKQALLYQVQTPLDASYFAQLQEGVVRLEGTTFTPLTTGLIRVSGACTLKRAPGRFQLYLTDGTNPAIWLASTSNDVASFSATYQARPLSLYAYQESLEAANGIKCNLLFEAVK